MTDTTKFSSSNLCQFAGAVGTAAAMSEAMATAIGSAVEQGTAIGLGFTNKFSILSDAESAFTAGMGSELNISGQLFQTQLLENASINMSEALVDMAVTGRPLDIGSFITNSLTMTTANVPAVSAMAPSLQSTLSTAIDTASEEIQFGKMDGDQVADDYAAAYGSAVGDEKLQAANNQPPPQSTAQSTYATAKAEATSSITTATTASPISASSNTPQPSQSVSQTQSPTTRLAKWQAQQQATPQKDWSDFIEPVNWPSASSLSTSAVAPNPTTESLSSAFLNQSLIQSQAQFGIASAMQQFTASSQSSGEVYSSASSYLAVTQQTASTASAYPPEPSFGNAASDNSMPWSWADSLEADNQANLLYLSNSGWGSTKLAEELENPMNYVGSFAEYGKQYIESNGLDEEYQRSMSQAEQGFGRVSTQLDMMENNLIQGLTDDTSALTFDTARYLQLSTMEASYAGLLGKYGLLSMTVDSTIFLAKSSPFIEAGIGMIQVHEAQPGTKLQTGFEAAGEILVGTAATFASAYLAVLATGASGGTLAPEAVAGTLAGAAIGGAAGSKLGDDAYNEYIKIQSKF